MAFFVLEELGGLRCLTQRLCRSFGVGTKGAKIFFGYIGYERPAERRFTSSAFHKENFTSLTFSIILLFRYGLVHNNFGNKI